MFFTVALVKSPPVMEPVLVFSTVPVMVPPVIVPKLKGTYPRKFARLQSR